MPAASEFDLLFFVGIFFSDNYPVFALGLLNLMYCTRYNASMQIQSASPMFHILVFVEIIFFLKTTQSLLLYCICGDQDGRVEIAKVVKIWNFKLWKILSSSSEYSLFLNEGREKEVGFFPFLPFIVAWSMCGIHAS